MSYSFKVVFGSDGLPVIEGATGTLPPAGHVITISGHYELPWIEDDEKAHGRLTLNAQHWDGTGDHIISAYQFHNRATQGATPADAKILANLIATRNAIREAEGPRPAPDAPLPPVGPPVTRPDEASIHEDIL